MPDKPAHIGISVRKQPSRTRDTLEHGGPARRDLRQREMRQVSPGRRARCILLGMLDEDPNALRAVYQGPFRTASVIIRREDDRLFVVLDADTR